MADALVISTVQKGRTRNGQGMIPLSKVLELLVAEKYSRFHNVGNACHANQMELSLFRTENVLLNYSATKRDILLTLNQLSKYFT